jgi:para-nitrobenzyl esterase
MPIDEILAGLERKIPMLVGTNKEEAKLFTTYSPDMIEPSDAALNSLFGKNSVYVMSAYREASLLYPVEEAWHRTLTDYIYRFATIRFAEWAAGHDQPVWVYQFDFLNRLGAHHGSESAFTIHSLESNPQADDNPVADLFTVPANGTELATSMHAAWASFIHSGVPLAEGLPEWPKFTLSDRSIMILNQECSTTSLPLLPDTQFPNQVIALSDEPTA